MIQRNAESLILKAEWNLTSKVVAWSIPNGVSGLTGGDVLVPSKKKRWTKAMLRKQRKQAEF
jgi:hypothetical protein